MNVLDLDLDLDLDLKKSQHAVHLYVRKRTGRKYITTVEGLANFENIKIKKLLRTVKVKYCCSGSYDSDTDVITFSGDQRDNIQSLLKEVDKNMKIIVHGF